MESFELLLQVIVDEPRLDFTSGLEEDVAAWVRDDVHTPPHANKQKGTQKIGNMLVFLLVGVIPKECPRVQQATWSLEQVSSDRAHLDTTVCLQVCANRIGGEK